MNCSPCNTLGIAWDLNPEFEYESFRIGKPGCTTRGKRLSDNMLISLMRLYKVAFGLLGDVVVFLFLSDINLQIIFLKFEIIFI